MQACLFASGSTHYSPDLWTPTVFLQKSPSNTSADLTDCRTLRVDSREHRMRDGLHRLRGLLLLPSLVELSSLCCIPPFRPLKSSTAPKILSDFSFVKSPPFFYLTYLFAFFKSGLFPHGCVIFVFFLQWLIGRE